MAINPSSVTTVSVQDQIPFAIELVSTQPVDNEVFSPTRLPGTLVGWYNGATDSVQLYIVNRAGNRFLKIL